MDTSQRTGSELGNGAALASLLAAAFGAFALGVIVILTEADIFAAPALYGPAGGLSGRTTFAVIIWLVAWALLHRRWRQRDFDGRRVFSASLVLIGLGLLLLFPPVWRLL